MGIEAMPLYDGACALRRRFSLIVRAFEDPYGSLEGNRLGALARLIAQNVGVIARDKNGPVADLTKDDFVVLDRGKPQKISVFSVESSESASQPAQPLPQNTFSDLPQYGAATPRSVTIVLLDNLNTLSGNGHEGYEDGPEWMEDLAGQWEGTSYRVHKESRPERPRGHLRSERYPACAVRFHERP